MSNSRPLLLNTGVARSVPWADRVWMLASNFRSCHEVSIHRHLVEDTLPTLPDFPPGRAGLDLPAAYSI